MQDDLLARRYQQFDNILSGDIWKYTSNPGAASTAAILHIESLGTNWASGAAGLRITGADNDCIPLIINDGTTNTILLQRAGNITLNGVLTLSGGDTITTTANGNIVITAHGTGIIQLTKLMDATTAGIRNMVSIANVTTPVVTDAELDAAFGTPAVVGAGFTAFIDDNNADTAMILCVSNGASWWYTGLTKAV